MPSHRFAEETAEEMLRILSESSGLGPSRMPLKYLQKTDFREQNWRPQLIPNCGAKRLMSAQKKLVGEEYVSINKCECNGYF